MATAEERLKILKMVEDGKISAEDGAKLLAALNDSRKGASAPGASDARWFRVRITDLATGKTKNTVNIPLGLVSVAMRAGARFVPHLDNEQFVVLTEALKTGSPGKIIEVTDDTNSERIEIFVE